MKATVFQTSVPSIASLDIVVTRRSIVGFITAKHPTSRVEPEDSPDTEGATEGLLRMDMDKSLPFEIDKEAVNELTSTSLETLDFDDDRTRWMRLMREA
jgi:hypothetical protein